jgi:hypothetical protein
MLEKREELVSLKKHTINCSLDLHFNIEVASNNNREAFARISFTKPIII